MDISGESLSAFASERPGLARLRRCAESLDADLRLYTTTIAMDDLNDVREYLGYDLSKIRSIGFACQYPIRKALEETWDWYGVHGAQRPA